MTSNTMLGRIGQATLEKWGPQAEITVNCPEHDERGWDAFLQVGPAAFSGPADLAPPQISCLFQIKTTRGTERSEPIKLSNWQRMCSDPVPWFVLAIHLDDHDEPASAYLVHIGEAWCEQVLQRLRELGAAEAQRLHTHTLSVSWSDGERLTRLHGSELLRLIRQHVVPDQHAYVQQKLRWFTELGYAAGPGGKKHAISLTVCAQEPAALWTGFADLGVRLRSTLPGEWFAKLSDVRFGFRGTVKEFGRESGEMEFRAPSQAQVSLRLLADGAATKPLSFDFYRASAVFPFLPKEFEKLRFVSESVELVTTCRQVEGELGAAAEFTFSFPMDAAPLAQIESICSWLRIATNPDSQGLVIELSTARGTFTLPPAKTSRALPEKLALRVV
jgi:hypothetical protein